MTRQRYTGVAILLHWAIAALILWQIGFGLWLADALAAEDEATRFAAFQQTQIHKSLGLTVLALSVLRLLWRFTHPAPTLPEGMKWYERLGAHASHLAFYGVMILAPLTGWAMVSASVELGGLPTVYFGLFEIPHLPLLPGLGDELKGQLEHLFGTAHAALAWGTIGLLALHVGAALKHHIVDRDDVLLRMLPGRNSAKEGAEAPRAGLGGWAAALGLAGATALGVGVVVAYDSAPSSATQTAATAPLSIAEPNWRVLHDQSVLSFEGSNSGSAFTGVFKEWRAEIAFDPSRLDASEVVVEIAMASAETGDLQYDGALPGGDWFDAATHPTGRFHATAFERRLDAGPDAYVASGALTLRGVTKPIELAFTLTIEGDRATMAAAYPLNRLDFGIGERADATGAWVGLDVPVTIEISAERVD